MANMNCKHCTDMRQVMRAGDKYWVTTCSQFPGKRRKLNENCGRNWCDKFEAKFPKTKTKKGE